ncbi:MAG TPA: hypothetical protein VFV38_31175 [Ktedonobacteraceae bacterium]|nr:hypothetical protein [Ktedonobacteraceae bacterium]
MKLGKLAEYYYTAAEARRVLGVDESTFQYWGRTNRINRITLPGRKQPVYSKKEIDEIANEIEATVIMEKAKEIEFRAATIKDLEEENQLAQLVFGRAAGAMPRKTFLERNSETDYHLYDQGKLVAYLTIYPLKHETLTKFMNGEIRGWQIAPEDIELFKPGKPLECVIMDMVTTPTVPPTKRTEYGRRMLVNITRVFQSWGERGIEIKKLHAIGGTSAGQRILTGAGFKEIKQVGTGRVAFELDIENTDERLLKAYREAIAKYKSDKTQKR